MVLIICNEECLYQKDGYCRLESLSTVNVNESRCPYFKPKLFNNRNSLCKTSDSYEF